MSGIGPLPVPGGECHDGPELYCTWNFLSGNVRCLDVLSQAMNIPIGRHARSEYDVEMEAIP